MTTTIGRDNAEPVPAEGANEQTAKTIDAGEIDPTPLMTVGEIQERAQSMTIHLQELRNNFIDEMDSDSAAIVFIGGQLVEVLNFWLSEGVAQTAKLIDRAQLAEVQLAGAQKNNEKLVEANQQLNQALTQKIFSAGAVPNIPSVAPGPGRRR